MASMKVLANLTGPKGSSPRVWKHDEAPVPKNHPTQFTASSSLFHHRIPQMAPDGKWGHNPVTPI